MLFKRRLPSSSLEAPIRHSEPLHSGEGSCMATFWIWGRLAGLSLNTLHITRMKMVATCRLKFMQASLLDSLKAFWTPCASCWRQSGLSGVCWNKAPLNGHCFCLVKQPIHPICMLPIRMPLDLFGGSYYYQCESTLSSLTCGL